MLEDNNVDMITWGGNKINFLMPQESTVDLDDLLFHLSGQRRFLGGIPWTVTQHLLLCSRLVEVLKLWEFGYCSEKLMKGVDPTGTEKKYLLMGFASSHDLSEGILGDVPSGLKKHLKDYKKLEKIWDLRIHNELGLDLTYKDYLITKIVDLVALETEATYFRHPAAPLITSRVKETYVDTGFNDYLKSKHYTVSKFSKISCKTLEWANSNSVPTWRIKRDITRAAKLIKELEKQHGS